MVLSFLSNQSIERILLFLFVNVEGYGSQISSCIQSSLTPIQQALAKLEDHKIILSTLRKNKRMYSLNSTHPLFHRIRSSTQKNLHAIAPLRKKHNTSDLVFEPTRRLTLKRGS